MWTLIIISHILMLASFVMLTISAIQGHFFDITPNTPLLPGDLKLQNFSIISILIYVFTQTLILFLIITINKEIKKIISDNSLSIVCKEYMYYKKKMHIHTSLNLVLISTLAILFSAVHQKSIEENTHAYFFVIGLIHYMYTIKIQFHIFKEISKIIVRLNDKISSKL